VCVCVPRVFCASKNPSFLARWRVRGPAGTGSVGDSACICGMSPAIVARALCALALPMLALRVPAVRALAVRARAVRLRAGRVVCLCSVRLHRAALVDVADTTSLVDPGNLTCPYPFSYIGLLELAHMHVPAMLY
jgi:hypothetical protein